VLQDLWPLLQTMVMGQSDGGRFALLMLRDEGVCRGAFDLLSSLVSVLSLSVGAQADLTQMLDCVAQGICMALKSKLSAASSALKTVTSMCHSDLLLYIPPRLLLRVHNCLCVCCSRRPWWCRRAAAWTARRRWSRRS